MEVPDEKKSNMLDWSDDDVQCLMSDEQGEV